MWRDWSRWLALLAAFVAVSCKGGTTKPVVVDDVPAALEKAGAEVTLSKQGKAVERVSFKNQTVSDEMVDLMRRLPGLPKLTLQACPQPPASRLKEVGQLVSLQRLYLTDNKWLTDADLQDLVPLIHLRELNLAGCEQVTDAGLKHLAGMKSLTKLEFFECKQITEAGLNELVALPNLRELGVADCPRLTAEGLSQLKKTMKNCTIRDTPY
jgi:hypothetical protein